MRKFIFICGMVFSGKGLSLMIRLSTFGKKEGVSVSLE